MISAISPLLPRGAGIYTPQPWNLFPNFFINSNGSFTVRAPDTKPCRFRSKAPPDSGMMAPPVPINCRPAFRLILAHRSGMMFPGGEG